MVFVIIWLIHFVGVEVVNLLFGFFENGVYFAFPDFFLLDLWEEMVSSHPIVNVHYFPVSEIHAIAVQELGVSVINHGDLRWTFEFAFENGDMVTSVVFRIN